MTPWLALSLGLCLGQTPELTPAVPPDADIQAPVATDTATQKDVAQLRDQVQSLQTQLEESASNTELLQQQLTGMQERAQELERMRQQRLSELERARSWLIAADQALLVGDLGAGDAMGEADTVLAQVIENATSTGSGQTAVIIEAARDSLAQALEATERRDTFLARSHLLVADWQLREARRRNLDTSGATVIAQ